MAVLGDKIQYSSEVEKSDLFKTVVRTPKSNPDTFPTSESTASSVSEMVFHEGSVSNFPHFLARKLFDELLLMFLKLGAIFIFPRVGLAWLLLEDIAPIVLSVSARFLGKLIISTLRTTYVTSGYLLERMV